MSKYYIDSLNGCDGNDGLSPEKAYKSFAVINTLTLSAGDGIYIKRETVVEGCLVVNGSGTQEDPVIITAYGVGNKKPVIVSDDSQSAAVTVKGEYVTVDGLEVINPRGYFGICVCPSVTGAVHDMTVKNCYVHDVAFESFVYTFSHRVQCSGGIVFETNKETPTWFENAHIENNVIEKVNRTGIWFGGQWFNRFKNSFPWVTNKAEGMDDPWYPHKNVYIGWNSVDHSYGDGIIGIGCKGLLMEHNRVYYANCRSVVNPTNVGLWSMCCDGAVIQYNEVAYTGREAGGDGEGYDIDNCSRNTVIQYNYSHHNAGGFLLICNNCNDDDSHRDHIVRNNLSVNDATKEGCALFNITGTTSNISILNNTVIRTEESHFRLFEIANYCLVGVPTDITFANNLIYSSHKKNWNNFMTSGNFTVEHNVFFNICDLPKKDNLTERDNQYDLFPLLNNVEENAQSAHHTEAYVPMWNSPLLRLGKHYDECADTDYCGLDTKNHNYVGAFYYKDANIG